MKMPTSIFTAVLAAALAVPGLCGSPVADANALKPTIPMPTGTTPPGNGHVHAWTPVVLAQDDIPIFTGSVPEPTETLSCEKSLGPIHHTTNGKGFLLNCDFDFPGNDLANLQVDSWAKCMEACSVTSGCKAFTYYHFVLGNINCYLKTAGTPDTWEVGPGIWLGWLAWDSAGTPTPIATTAPSKTTTTPLRTVTATSLFGYTQLAGLNQGSWTKQCYSDGAGATSDQMKFAATTFCSSADLGGFFPDRVILPVDGITLEYVIRWNKAIYLIVNTKENCVIDFNSLDFDECVEYFTQGIIDPCSTEPMPGPDFSGGEGGLLDNDCTHWVMDPQIVQLGGRTGVHWFRGVFDGLPGR